MKNKKKPLFAFLGGKRKEQKLGSAVLDDDRAVAWDDETGEIWFVIPDSEEKGEAVPDGTYTTKEGEAFVVENGVVVPEKDPAEDGVELHTVVLENGLLIDIDPATLDAFKLNTNADGSFDRVPLQDGEYYTLDWYGITVVGGKFSKEHSSYPYVAPAPASSDAPASEGEQMTALCLSLREQGDCFREELAKYKADLAKVVKDRDELKTALSKIPGGTKIDTTPKTTSPSRKRPVLASKGKGASLEALGNRWKNKAKKPTGE